MTTQDVMQRPPAPPAYPDEATRSAAWQALTDAPAPVALPAPAQPAARHLEETPPDDEATVVIGRHRQDGTFDTRPAAGASVPAARTRRGGWIGRVTAAAVSRLRRRPSTGEQR